MTDQFIITRMGVEAGESLERIVARKDAERAAGNGEFWWGIGTSLGRAGLQSGKTHRGGLPVLFAKMRSKPKRIDIAPDDVFVWTHWETLEGRGEIPQHVVITSRGVAAKSRHYALPCSSDTSITLDGQHRFDPELCRTANGRVMGGSQNTALLNGSPYGHATGKYAIAFEATLSAPYCPKLVTSRCLTAEERLLLDTWHVGSGDDWLEVAERIRVPR